MIRDRPYLPSHPRFNKVAWEGTTSDGLRFINIAGEPDKWFGFSAVEGETGDKDGLVSIDFYGFTYGKKEETHQSDYIALDDLSGETMPEKELVLLKHTETVSDDGTMLNDLLREGEQTVRRTGFEPRCLVRIFRCGDGIHAAGGEIAPLRDQRFPVGESFPEIILLTRQ